MIMATTFLLVIVTLIKGFSVEENPFFILIESILNLLIIGDFFCRLKLMGVRRFIEGTGRLWNWLDAFVVLGSLLFFLAIVFSHSSSSETVEEVSEVVLLVFWALFQTLRVIFIAKRQRLA